MSARSMLRRLARLEDEGVSSTCPVCGHGPDSFRFGTTCLTVIVPPADGPEPLPTDPERCAACGRARVVVLRVMADRELHPQQGW